MQFTQKETSLLTDLKSQEQLCIEKYTKYSAEAHDQQLKNLLAQIGQAETKHLDTLNQISGGTVPSMQSGGNQQTAFSFTPIYGAGNTDQNKQKDNYLCTDLLATEKYVSSAYNTSIFEFKDTGVRDALNHIQKEEQRHGEQIYNYMAQNAMYG